MILKDKLTLESVPVQPWSNGCLALVDAGLLCRSLTVAVLVSRPDTFRL